MDTTKRIGLVDDEETVRFSTKEYLKLNHYEVEAFASAEALLKGRVAEFDCLIIDFRLEGMSGLELLEELGERAIAVPVIVVSGYTSESDSNELRAAGARNVIDKPVDPQELLASVERILDASEDS